jgi:hypothetical protein
MRVIIAWRAGSDDARRTPLDELGQHRRRRLVVLVLSGPVRKAQMTEAQMCLGVSSTVTTVSVPGRVEHFVDWRLLASHETARLRGPLDS